MSELEDLLKGLDEQLDPERIRKREAEFNRPQDRSPLIDFTATILPFDDNPVITVQKPSWSERHLKMNLGDVDVLRISNKPGEQDYITVRLPDEGREFSSNDELELMMGSIKALVPGASMLKLPGLRITFNEDTVEYPYRGRNKDTGQYEDRKGTRFYYRAVKVEGTQAKTTGPSEVGIESAMGLLIEAGAEGMKETDFHKQVSKLPIPTADKAYVGGGKFATDMIAKGRVERRGDALVAV